MNERLIGGMFGLGESLQESDRRAPFLHGKEMFLVNARSAIKIIVDTLKPHNVWLPSYLCDVVLASVHRAKIQFYAVDRRLQVSRDWLVDLQKGDLVVLIDYFGFVVDPSLPKSIKQYGCWVVEDASQALLSTDVGRYSDFVVFSPRKFLGVPDGGILRNNTDQKLFNIQLQSPPPNWWLRSFSSTILRREFDLHGGERTWFKLFQDVERTAPVGLFAMSEMARMLLDSWFDYPFMIQRRIENYNILDSHLNKFALFQRLPSDIVPLGFPILLQNRDHVRRKLFERNIYPPIHWAITGIVPPEYEDSHALSRNILTLVCDQRYSLDEMEKTAAIVLREAQND